MIHIEPKDLTVPVVHAYLLGGVAPRPIALTSTISSDGVLNLSPFSFFNAFGANPPTIAFSPSRRGRDASFKDTYNNLITTKECVVQAVTYSMLHQVNLASAEWPPETDEFEKVGLTPIASHIVKPPRVAESPFQMECILKQMVPLGEAKASGNLAICEVVKFHIAEDLLEGNVINPARIDHIARNGGDWWTRVTGETVFRLKKPGAEEAIGYDALPDSFRRSQVLTANNLGQLAGLPRTELPTQADIDALVGDEPIPDATYQKFERLQQRGDYAAMFRAARSLAQTRGLADTRRLFEWTARTALEQADDRVFAWKVLLYIDQLG